MSRPFGVAILFAGIDEKGPQLYHMDPSGKHFFLFVNLQLLFSKRNTGMLYRFENFFKVLIEVNFYSKW